MVFILYFKIFVSCLLKRKRVDINSLWHKIVEEKKDMGGEIRLGYTLEIYHIFALELS